MLPSYYIGDLYIDAYSFNALFGIIISLLISIIYAKTKKIKVYKCILLFIIELFLAYLGGRLLYMIENNDWESRFSNLYINGGILLLPLVPLISSKLLKIDITKAFSLTAIIGIYFIAQAKVGCFLAGCCGGFPSEFGFYFKTNPGVKIFPIQLVQFVLWFIVLGIVVYFAYSKKIEKYSFPIFLLLYDFTLLITEIFMDNDKIFFGITIAQFIAIIYCIVALIWIFVLSKQSSVKRVNN